jgi:hypothetical protein
MVKSTEDPGPGNLLGLFAMGALVLVGPEVLLPRSGRRRGFASAPTAVFRRDSPLAGGLPCTGARGPGRGGGAPMARPEDPAGPVPGGPAAGHPGVRRRRWTWSSPAGEAADSATSGSGDSTPGSALPVRPGSGGAVAVRRPGQGPGGPAGRGRHAPGGPRAPPGLPPGAAAAPGRAGRKPRGAGWAGLPAGAGPGAGPGHRDPRRGPPGAPGRGCRTAGPVLRPGDPGGPGPRDPGPDPSGRPETGRRRVGPGRGDQAGVRKPFLDLE